MPDLFDDVKAFHDKFGLLYYGPPRPLPGDLSEFRIKFMDEELNEYEDARDAGNLEGQLDALVDLVYVVLGTAALHGFDFNKAFSRVHDANMAKVRAEHPSDSKRGSTYDVIKPAGWVAPDLSDLV